MESIFAFNQYRPLTEEQIERKVEIQIDRLDRHLLSNQITQEQYDRDIMALDTWAIQQHEFSKSFE